MNKKILSAILFSALIVGTTGTFTSCKDYDDDIKDLQGQIDGLAGDITKLQGDLSTLGTTVNGLTYVKNVTLSGSDLIVTDKNGNDHTYAISNTNTTYTLDVQQDGNKVIIILKDQDGNEQKKEISFTDETFDAGELKLDKDGNITYKGEKTGVTMPAIPSIPTLTKVDYVENGVVLGYDLKYGNNEPICLRINDILPITSFEYIPNKILAEWGERVIVFEKNNYNPVKIEKNAVVVESKVINYLPNQAKPEYHVNPSSATEAQLANEGKANVLDKEVSLVTRGTNTGIISWKETKIDGGIATVTLEADPNKFTTDKEKLNEIALQFTTKAGNKITTEYVGVINKAEKINLVLADKEVTALTPKDAACHFATSKDAAEKQAAKIGNDNKGDKDNAHLVQEVGYAASTSTSGINLKTLVTTCNIADAAGHKFFDYAAHADIYELTFYAEPYKVNNTPQEQYMTLEDGIFHAKNYGGVDRSAIGKAPIVRAELRDKTNNNALVAAAWIKLLIVEDTPVTEVDYVAEHDTIVGLGCNADGVLMTTTDEFMSAHVYNFVNNSKLEALSKQQWHHIYAFSQSATAEYKNIAPANGKWTVTATEYDPQNEANQVVRFAMTGTFEKAKNVYEAYAVFAKTTDATKLANVANSSAYPANVVIKYTVTVKDIDFTAHTPTDATAAGSKISNLWSTFKNLPAIDIYCVTPDNAGTTANALIAQDLLSNFYGRTVNLQYTKADEYVAGNYPSFVHSNMTAKFVFSTSNEGRLVNGNDGNVYSLKVVAGTKIHALLTKDGKVIASETAKDANLVAELSGTEDGVAENYKVVYQKNGVAKAVLNYDKRDGADMFYATIDLQYYNGCDQYVTVTDGAFNAKFIRPVNVERNEGKFFNDGNNQGASVLKLGELVVLKDWRLDSSNDGLNEFAKHLNYYKYYNVKAIQLHGDTKNIQTDLNHAGKFESIEKAFGSKGAATLLEFAPKSQTYTSVPTVVPDFGTVTYTNKEVKVNAPFYLRIPIEVVYEWGTVIENIDVEVKVTL